MSSLTPRASYAARLMRITSLAACVLLSSIILGCGGDDATSPSDSEPDPNADRLEITFGYATGPSTTFESMALYQSAKDGRLVTPFISTPDVELDPEWSNDGSKLAFVRFTAPLLAPATIWVANADGTGLQQIVVDPSPVDPSSSETLFNNQTYPTWSPDRQSIAFNRSIGTTESGIGVVGVDGSGLRWLITGANNPSWSVNNRIAFDMNGGIWTIQPDGTGLTQVTSVGGDLIPKWSRDGTRLVFAHSVGNASGTAYDIVTTRGDGTDRRTLATGGNNVNPSWSPDGAFVLYEHVDLSEPALPKCTLHKVPSAGGAAVNLTPDRAAGYCGGSSWRPL